MRLQIDKQACVGCCSCEMACTSAHEGRYNPRHSRIRVPLTFPLPSPPVVCRHCKKARCIEVCPSGALYKEKEVVRFEREKCTLCGACVAACPFHAIWIEKDRVFKCDLCGGIPFCAQVCPFGAIKVVD